MMKPEVTRTSVLSMQVCVPRSYTDEEIIAFAEHENPCGTTCGWQIRREGDEALRGAPERAQCEKRADAVHVMLDA